jgi:hypothetical protein
MFKFFKVKKTDEAADALEQIYRMLKDENKLAVIRAYKINIDPNMIKDLFDQYEIVKRNGKPTEIAAAITDAAEISESIIKFFVFKK